MSTTIKPIYIALALCIFGCTIFDKAQAATLKSPGVWSDRSSINALSEQYEKRLTDSLRRITGLGNIGFTPDGSLSLGDTSAAKGGSATARELLSRVLLSGIMFIIEDHSDSDTINFGQLSKGEIYRDPGRSAALRVQRVRLDFADFSEMKASPDVRASFDEGFVLLHELLHGLGYTDPPDQKEVGQIEEIINRVRIEIGVMIRDRYYGEPIRISTSLIAVRLRFRSRATDADGSGRQRHYLIFLIRDKPTLASSGQKYNRSAE